MQRNNKQQDDDDDRCRLSPTAIVEFLFPHLSLLDLLSWRLVSRSFLRYVNRSVPLFWPSDELLLLSPLHSNSNNQSQNLVEEFGMRYVDLEEVLEGLMSGSSPIALFVSNSRHLWARALNRSDEFRFTSLYHQGRFEPIPKDIRRELCSSRNGDQQDASDLLQIFRVLYETQRELTLWSPWFDRVLLLNCSDVASWDHFHPFVRRVSPTEELVRYTADTKHSISPFSWVNTIDEDKKELYVIRDLWRTPFLRHFESEDQVCSFSARVGKDEQIHFVAGLWKSWEFGFYAFTIEGYVPQPSFLCENDYYQTEIHLGLHWLQFALNRRCQQEQTTSDNPNESPGDDEESIQWCDMECLNNNGARNKFSRLWLLEGERETETDHADEIVENKT